MTDSHTHFLRGGVREFLCDPCQDAPSAAPAMRFAGFHPWNAADCNLDALRARLSGDARCGVGEIGLDRLKSPAVGDDARRVFSAQLAVAAEFRRPVALHGAKCWGQVLEACRPFAGRIPAFIFHGFSRSPGLLGAISSINGFISVGPAVLNDHAVNYRALVKSLPEALLLAETDASDASAPSIADVVAGIAAVRGMPCDAVEAVTDANAGKVMLSF